MTGDCWDGARHNCYVGAGGGVRRDENHGLRAAERSRRSSRGLSSVKLDCRASRPAQCAQGAVLDEGAIFVNGS